MPGTAHVETSLISPNIQRLTPTIPFRSFSQPQELQKKLGKLKISWTRLQGRSSLCCFFPLVAIQGLFSCFSSISVLIRVIAKRSMRCLGRVDGNNQSTNCSCFRVLRCTLGMSLLDLVLSGTCMVGVFSHL